MNAWLEDAQLFDELHVHVDNEHLTPVANALKRTRSQSSIDVTDTDSSQKHLVALKPNPNDDTYAASRFGGIGDFMRRKRAKLQIQNADIREGASPGGACRLFNGLSIYVRVPPLT
jgi:hypothetical protein